MDGEEGVQSGEWLLGSQRQQKAWLSTAGVGRQAREVCAGARSLAPVARTRQKESEISHCRSWAPARLLTPLPTE